MFTTAIIIFQYFLIQILLLGFKAFRNRFSLVRDNKLDMEYYSSFYFIFSLSIALIIFMLSFLIVFINSNLFLCIDLVFVLIVSIIFIKLPLKNIEEIHPFAGRAIITIKFKNNNLNKLHNLLSILMIVFIILSIFF